MGIKDWANRRWPVAIDLLLALAVVLGIELFRDRPAPVVVQIPIPLRLQPPMPATGPVPAYALLQETDLQREVKSLQCDGIGLQKVFDQLHEQTGLNLIVRYEPGADDLPKADTPVTVHLEHVPLITALKAVLYAAKADKWDYMLRDNLVEIGPERDMVSTRIYDLSPLIELAVDHALDREAKRAHLEGREMLSDRAIWSQDSVDAIIRLVEETVATDDWKDEGGQIGSLREWDRMLFVTCNARMHRDVVALLEQIANGVVEIEIHPATNPSPQPGGVNRSPLF